MTVSKEKIHPYSYIGMKGLVHIPVSALNREEKFRMADEIIKASCKYYGITLEKMMKKERYQPQITARHISAYLIKKMTDLKDGEISKLFGKDRTTIIHSVELISGYLKINEPKNIITDLNNIKMMI